MDAARSMSKLEQTVQICHRLPRLVRRYPFERESKIQFFNTIVYLKSALGRLRLELSGWDHYCRFCTFSQTLP